MCTIVGYLQFILQYSHVNLMEFDDKLTADALITTDCCKETPDNNKYF